jgi:upstream activation factor subunit UAF30
MSTVLETSRGPSSQTDLPFQLSRPQTVKKIWEYVKARDLQDPADKRQIRCDDAMRAVFKQDSVHMFTMNKILNMNLYPVEED